MSSAITDLNCGGCGLTAVTPATVSDVGQGLFLGSTREKQNVGVSRFQFTSSKLARSFPEKVKS